MKNLQKKIDLVSDFYKTKNFEKAEKLCKKLVSEYPKADILYNILGLILTEEKKINEAIEFYEKGIKIKPDSAIMYNNIAGLHKTKGNYKKAETLYKKSISLNGSIADTFNNIGNLYKLTNEYEKSIENYLKSIKIKPNFTIAYYNLGIIYKNLGDKENAKINLKKVLNLNPFMFSAHRALSQITSYKKNDLHLKKMESIYDDKKIIKERKAELIFALAKAYDDIKDYKKAFKYYQEANSTQNKILNFSISSESNEFSKIKKIFNKSFIKRFSVFGNKSCNPIFILGMPRSGTTLIEQIISSHPKVFAGDELNLIPHLLDKHFAKLKKITSINSKIIQNFALDYLNETKKMSLNSEFVTDKLPINFKWVGLIKIIFPNAKIIHCKRNAKDNCLSIYKNFFTNKQMSFSYDLNDIIKFYNLYENLIRHWKNEIPDFIYDIKYEDLIKNSNKEIKNIVKWCDLTWNENCLEFYNNKRLIKTASDTQARSKLYSSSINNFKNYKLYVGNIFKKLTN